MRHESIRWLLTEVGEEVIGTLPKRRTFMIRPTLIAVGVLLTLSQAGTIAQGAKPPQLATDITAAEVQAVIKAPTGGGDRQMKVVDMGKYNVSVGVLRRAATKPGAPVGAINHEHVTGVYYI